MKNIAEMRNPFKKHVKEKVTGVIVLDKIPLIAINKIPGGDRAFTNYSLWDRRN